MKKILRILFNRLTIIALLIILQVGMMIYLLQYFSKVYTWIPILTTIIEITLILDLVNRDMNADLKLPWLAVVMIVPVAGIIIYVIFSRNKASKKDVKKYMNINKEIQDLLKDIEADPKVLNEYAGQSNYIKNTCKSSLFKNESTKYFACGEKFYQEYINDLLNAQKFIFMEYFIFEEGQMLDSILKILKDKVKNGIEVRIMYDDLGCINKVKQNFKYQLEQFGIKCVKFSPFKPIVSAVHNNRDHRKITVIDGVISYVGGINIADEYINVKSKYGYWKDSAIKIVGNATNQFTLFFLQLFNLMNKDKDNYSNYLIYNKELSENNTKGYIQPFCDGPSPLLPDLIGENVYVNLINQAKNTINICTPYLIIDSVLKNSLILAAKRNVKVNIFMPHIPDKKIINILSKSNYIDLIKNGINIYEYKPGFLHSKNFLVDDELAVVGTINLDYRSLVHHYECGVWMYKTDSLLDIKKDFINLEKDSIKINSSNFKMKWYEKVIYRIISIFSPMM